MNQLSKISKNLGRAISKNGPTILTVISVAGLAGTVGLAVGATPEAVLLIEDEEYIKKEELGNDAKLTALEKFKLCWKLYIPAAITAATTITCIIGSNRISNKRYAALGSVYALTETAFREYKGKVAETIGRNKELKIRDEISADHVKINPPGTNEVIFTGKGDVLCMDSTSGRYFKSEYEHIRRVINDLNRDLINQDFISLNDLYYVLGLSNIPLGDNMGWKLEDGEIVIDFSSCLTPENEPCLVLRYNIVNKH